MTRLDKDIMILISYYYSLRSEYQQKRNDGLLDSQQIKIGQYHMDQIENACQKILDLRGDKQ